MLIGYWVLLACTSSEGPRPEPTDGGDARDAAQEGGTAAEESDSGTAGDAGGCLPAEAGNGSSCETIVCQEGQSIARRLAPRGDECARPVLVTAFDTETRERQIYVDRGTTECAGNEHESTQCASQGPDVFYELDLRSFEEARTVYLQVTAEFDASVRIERASCRDPVIRDCNEDHAPGVSDPFLAVELEPDLYRVVIDGETKGDAGEYLLEVQLTGEVAVCAAPPTNDHCDQAVDLDPKAARQVVIGSNRCASDDVVSPDFISCNIQEYRAGDALYRLDLRDYGRPVRVRVRDDLPPTNFDTVLIVADSAGGTCFEPVFCANSQSNDGVLDVSLNLDPAEYFLAVEGSDAEEGDFALIIDLEEGGCSLENDRCDTATPLPSTPGTTHLEVDMGCIGPLDSVVRSAFYSLDLSSYTERVWLRISENAEPSLYVLANRAGQCGPVLYSEWDGSRGVLLEPAPYLLVLQADPDESRVFPLDITVEEAVPEPTAPCVGHEIIRCLKDYDSSCCDYTALKPNCMLPFIACGLDPSVYDCVCAMAEACCFDPDYQSQRCTEAFVTCGGVCPDADWEQSCF